MTGLHPALATELDGNSATIFGALKLELPDVTLRLLDGSAEIEIDSELYTAAGFLDEEDEESGVVWDSIEDFEDGSGDEAPGIVTTLLPWSDSAALLLSDPSVQGSATRIMFGARNDATGLVIGEPYLLFAGEIDVPTHQFGLGALAVEYAAVGGMDALFVADEGNRMVQAFHSQVWPGETGFEHVTGVPDNDYWGMSG